MRRPSSSKRMTLTVWNNCFLTGSENQFRTLYSRAAPLRPGPIFSLNERRRQPMLAISWFRACLSVASIISMLLVLVLYILAELYIAGLTTRQLYQYLTGWYRNWRASRSKTATPERFAELRRL